MPGTTEKRVLAAMLCLVAELGAQTKVHLRTQGKEVNFSAAPSTIPTKTGNVLPATCVAGELFFLLTAPSGENLHGCASANVWTPISSGGGGSGVQFTDFDIIRLSATQLRIGENCQGSAPCRVRFGGTVYVFTASATVTLSGGGSGTAFVFISAAGALTVAHNLAISCAGCVQTTGSAFPSGSLPLASWAAASGVWDTAGTDFRAFLGRDGVASGAGIVVTDSSTTTTVSINPAVVGLRVAVPATSATACTAGSWAADNSFFYVCPGTDTWRRVAVASW